MRKLGLAALVVAVLAGVAIAVLARRDEGEHRPQYVAVARTREGGSAVQLYDASTWELVASLADGDVLGDISIGEREVWFTELEGPEQRPSVWRVDRATSTRELVVRDGFSPALAPDERRLAYVRSQPPDGGIAQRIVIRDLATGDERRIEGYETGGDYPGPSRLTQLEWSPDGTRLLFHDGYESDHAGVLEPATARSLSDATFLANEHESAAWLDDDTIVSLRTCCYPEYTEPRELGVSEAASGAILRRLGSVGDSPVIDVASGPDGRVLVVVRNTELLERAPDGTVRVVLTGIRAIDG